MASVPHLNSEMKEVGKLDLPDEIFGVKPSKELLHEVVKWQLASRRAGTHSTLTKGETRGGGKKPFKQKGTGEARQGTNRSPLMPGGGVLFGPKPRDYSYSLPKSLRRQGLRAALSHLVGAGKFWLVDDLKTDGKSRKLDLALKKATSGKAVIIGSGDQDLLKRATRNLRNFKYLDFAGINVFDLLKYDGCVVTKDALEKLKTKLGDDHAS